MTQVQLELLIQRLIKDPQKYNRIEPERVKEKKIVFFARCFLDKKESIIPM